MLVSLRFTTAQEPQCCCSENGAACVNQAVSTCVSVGGSCNAVTPDNRCCCIIGSSRTCGVVERLCEKGRGVCETEAPTTVAPTSPAPTTASPTTATPTPVPTATPSKAPSFEPTCCCRSRSPMPGDQCLDVPVSECEPVHTCDPNPTCCCLLNNALPTDQCLPNFPVASCQPAHTCVAPVTQVPTVAPPPGPCCCRTLGTQCQNVDSAVCLKFGGKCDEVYCPCTYDPLLPPLVVPVALCVAPHYCVTSAPTTAVPTVSPTAVPTATPTAGPQCCCFLSVSPDICQDLSQGACEKLQGTCRADTCCCKYEAGRPCVDTARGVCEAVHPDFDPSNPGSGSPTVGFCQTEGCPVGTSSVLIDGFASGITSPDVNPGNTFFPSNPVASGTILGMERNYLLSPVPQTGETLASTATASSNIDWTFGRLSISSDSGVVPVLLLQYDGVDQSSTLDSATGLGGVDLTNGGTTNGIEILTLYSNNDHTYEVRIYEANGGVQTVTRSYPKHDNPTLNISLARKDFFEFPDFNLARRASAIEILITGSTGSLTPGSSGTDFEISLLEAACKQCALLIDFQGEEFIQAATSTFPLSHLNSLTHVNTHSFGDNNAIDNSETYPHGYTWQFSGAPNAVVVAADSILQQFGVSGVMLNAAQTTDVDGQVLRVDFVGAPTVSRLYKTIELTLFQKAQGDCTGGAPQSPRVVIYGVNMNQIGVIEPFDLVADPTFGTDYYSFKVSFSATTDHVRAFDVDFSTSTCPLAGGGFKKQGFLGVTNIGVTAIRFCPA